ncbi:MAG: hypothetical protein ACK43N_10895, partial [Pirellulaceae bacterium]
PQDGHHTASRETLCGGHPEVGGWDYSNMSANRSERARALRWATQYEELDGFLRSAKVGRQDLSDREQTRTDRGSTMGSFQHE